MKRKKEVYMIKDGSIQSSIHDQAKTYIVGFLKKIVALLSTCTFLKELTVF